MGQKIRDLAVVSVHAAPMGGSVFVAALFSGAALAATAVMLAGPPDLARTFILVGLLLAGVVTCRILFRLTGQAGWSARPWAQAVLVATASALALSLALFAFQTALNGEARWSALPWIGALAFGLCLSGCAMAVSFRGRGTAPQGGQPDADRFAARLPASFRAADIWALEAEDHYLRVHTSQGETLILMRLSDAVAELAGTDGAQIHRSWWVARSAIAEAAASGRGGHIVLPGGRRAPVSRSRLADLRKRGWL